MLTLALDTTTRGGSVAVTRGDRLLALVPGDATRTHGERLPGEIERALDAAGVARDDLELLVVAAGPGAFTGLRIGLAAVQGLAMVLQRPVIGVSALDALALFAADAGAPPGAPLGVWTEAQRGEVFSAQYAPDWAADLGCTPVHAPIVAPPHLLLAQLHDGGAPWPAFVGGAAWQSRDALRRAANVDLCILDAPPALGPWLSRLGQARAARGEAGPPHTLQPLYVRRPDAELERERRT